MKRIHKERSNQSGGRKKYRQNIQSSIFRKEMALREGAKVGRLLLDHQK
jgi:hypothetical protein